jgi:ferredoxin
MALEVEIDRDLCMGSGNCVYEAAGVFELDADSISTVSGPVSPEDEDEDKVMAAARKCPTGAITVRWDGDQPG